MIIHHDYSSWWPIMIHCDRSTWCIMCTRSRRRRRKQENQHVQEALATCTGYTDNVGIPAGVEAREPTPEGDSQSKINKHANWKNTLNINLREVCPVQHKWESQTRCPPPGILHHRKTNVLPILAQGRVPQWNKRSRETSPILRQTTCSVGGNKVTHNPGKDTPKASKVKSDNKVAWVRRQ